METKEKEICPICLELEYLVLSEYIIYDTQTNKHVEYTCQGCMDIVAIEAEMETIH